MSDAIGGGGGGGGDIFGNLQQILDPLGLFKGIGGGLDSILKGGGAEQMKQYGNVALSHVGQYSQGGESGTTSMPPAAQTDYQPPTEPTGYGQNLDAGVSHEGDVRQQQSSAMVQGEQRASTASAMTAAQQGEQRATSASAATANPYGGGMYSDTDAEKLKYLKIINAHFQHFDEQGMAPCDGKFDEANLHNVIGSPYATAEEKEAAHYLLTHRELLNDLMAASGGGSGMVVNGKVAEYIMRLDGTFNPPTPGVGQGPGVNKNQGNNGSKPTVPMGNNPPAQSPTAQTPPGSVPSGQTPVGRTLEESLSNVGQSMDAKEQALREAIASGDTNKISLAQLDFTKVQQRFQSLYELVGNLQRAYHEMSMHSIGHIR